MSYAEKQLELAKLINDAYLAGVMFARGEAPAVPYSLDIKKLREDVDKSLKQALRDKYKELNFQQ